MKRLITALLSAVAVSAFAGTSAMAFDNVHWSWYKNIREHVDIDVDIDINVYPTGLVEVEKLQIFLGNVYAQSTVHDIDNEQFNPGGHWDFTWCWRPVWIPNSFDARIDLPSVVSTAVAVGNNQNIVSDVPVFLHDGQFVANTRNGDQCEWCKIDGLVGATGPAYTTTTDGYGGGGGNLYTTLAELFTLGAVVGILTPADIHAYSTVYDIDNATVDSSATAVANNINVTLLSSNPNNHVLIADITQFAYANVSAVSNVCDVELTNYRNLSPDPTNKDPLLSTTLGRPIVSSTATAVGNNVSITVGVPTP